MRLDGLDADAKKPGHILVGVAFGNQLHRLAFARCERGVVRAHGALQIAGEDQIGDFRGKVGAMLAKHLEGGDEMGTCLRLEQVGAGAGLEDQAHDLFGLIGGEDEHLGLWKQALELAGGIEAIQVRHPDIHDDDVGLELFGLCDGFTAGGGLAADFPTGMDLDEVAETASDDFVIVGEEDSNWRRIGRPGEGSVRVHTYGIYEHILRSKPCGGVGIARAGYWVGGAS